jgi:hypothetical protein
MRIAFHAPAGELSESLRRSAQGAFASPIIDLAAKPQLVWKETISEVDLLLVDITAGDPAACYLVGLADALGKRVILLSPITEIIPAFFANRAAIVHRWNLDLLRTALEKFAEPSAAQSTVADDTPAGKFTQLFGDLLKSHGYVHRGPVEFDGATFTLREQEMDLPLVQAIAHRAKSLNVRVRLL